VARSTSAGFSDGNLTGLFDRIDAAMAAEVLQCTSEGISIHDGDAIRPRMQAARERVTTSHRLAVEAALAQQKALDRDRAIRDELERRAAFDREWGLDK
jgi:hypothetical protein